MKDIHKHAKSRMMGAFMGCFLSACASSGAVAAGEDEIRSAQMEPVHLDVPLFPGACSTELEEHINVEVEQTSGSSALLTNPNTWIALLDETMTPSIEGNQLPLFLTSDPPRKTFVVKALAGTNPEGIRFFLQSRTGTLPTGSVSVKTDTYCVASFSGAAEIANKVRVQPARNIFGRTNGYEIMYDTTCPDGQQEVVSWSPKVTGSSVALVVTKCFGTPNSGEVCEDPEQIVAEPNTYQLYVVGRGEAPGREQVTRVLISYSGFGSVAVEGSFMHCEVGQRIDSFSFGSAPHP